MSKIFIIFLPIFFMAGFGCQNQPEQSKKIVLQEYFKSGPRLVKIPIKDSTVADSLINLGIDVVVIEDEYIIAKLGGQNAARLQKMSLKMETCKEEELVQRLIRVVIKQKSDLPGLTNTGIDIWEIKGDTVLAQAYDKYIRKIQAKGFPVEIVEKNIQNVVKTKN